MSAAATKGQPEIKGWCPGALEPMEAADGLVIRVRPWTSQLTSDQLKGLAQVARQFGPGEVELTSRANVQIRQVKAADLPALHRALADLGLIDENADQERRRNFIFWPDPDINSLAKFERMVLQGVSGPDVPRLPSKFGLSVDLSEGQFLASSQSDIRVERGPAGLLVRAAGAETGRSVASLLEAAVAALELVDWFLYSGGVDESGRGRMSSHLANGHVLPEALGGAARPFPPQTCPPAGPVFPQEISSGYMLASAFGRFSAQALDDVAGSVASDDPIWVTPLRAFWIAQEPKADFKQESGVILDPANPLLRVHACTGAPGCAQALGRTRRLAQTLASSLPDGLSMHISGCSKGCAHPRPADVTMIAQPAGFDLVRHGTPWDDPCQAGLSLDQLKKALTG